jgi:hypothetical protein
VKVWVVVSDCGLNGPFIHGVYSERPEQRVVDQFVFDTSSTTGYQNTTVQEFIVDGEQK